MKPTTRNSRKAHLPMDGVQDRGIDDDVLGPALL
jgi:hypothetical protein